MHRSFGPAGATRSRGGGPTQRFTCRKLVFMAAIPTARSRSVGSSKRIKTHVFILLVREGRGRDRAPCGMQDPAPHTQDRPRPWASARGKTSRHASRQPNRPTCLQYTTHTHTHTNQSWRACHLALAAAAAVAGAGTVGHSAGASSCRNCHSRRHIGHICLAGCVVACMRAERENEPCVGGCRFPQRATSHRAANRHADRPTNQANHRPPTTDRRPPTARTWSAAPVAT